MHVTRKHVLKMHKASGTSRVFETHRLSLHKGSEIAFPSEAHSEWPAVNAYETAAMYV